MPVPQNAAAKPFVTAILTAAGAGERLGAELPKALVPVAGKPMFLWAAENLAAAQVVDQLIVTCPPAHAELFKDLLKQQRAESPSWQVVVGGDARQQSVANALAALPAATGIVLVHDAARPFASPDLIKRVVAAVTQGHDAVVPGLPVTDTIKSVVGAEPEQVTATVERSALRAIQTPQGFRRAVLERAYRLANRVATDDAGLVEALGLPVIVILGEASAMKITTPTDLAYAELIAAGSD